MQQMKKDKSRKSQWLIPNRKTAPKGNKCHQQNFTNILSEKHLTNYSFRLVSHFIILSTLFKLIHSAANVLSHDTVCADAVKCIHLALDEDKKNMFIWNWSYIWCDWPPEVFSVQEQRWSCLIIWFSFPDTLCSQGISRGTHTLRIRTHRIRNVCAGSYLWKSDCVLINFFQYANEFFFYVCVCFRSKGLRSLFSHCCVQWHNVLCCFHQSAKAPSLKSAYVHTNAQLLTY